MTSSSPSIGIEAGSFARPTETRNTARGNMMHYFLHGMVLSTPRRIQRSIDCRPHTAATLSPAHCLSTTRRSKEGFQVGGKAERVVTAKGDADFQLRLLLALTVLVQT